MKSRDAPEPVMEREGEDLRPCTSGKVSPAVHMTKRIKRETDCIGPSLKLEGCILSAVKNDQSML
ncbi:hypothetical protein PROFUN_02794 [Planoprotostelium fungivorum]|uniref:Uncharacterized protein n=1 Tax=Planoprotostelium fungivorum TaxID=1890364 RepID=A0A2P6NXR2_9EUKA|nr:hypothetical protein PROFUN_02794 [Planoprotostelium fungivorum]